MIEDGVAGPASSWRRAVVRAVRNVQFGSVEIVIHDGRVVQVETREKVRFHEAGRRRPGIRRRVDGEAWPGPPQERRHRADE
jgi:hypothetical protein